jgi:DNA-binding NtrC family response regulator
MEPFNVLIVDDDPAMTRSLARDLASPRYRITTTQSPDEALQILKLDRPEVVITDFHMPGLSGTQLLTHARALMPTGSRFLISGSPSLEMAMEAINLGAVTRLFIKPFSPTVLALAVGSELDRIELLRLTQRLLGRAEKMSNELSLLRAGGPALVAATREPDEDATHAEDYSPHDIDEILRRLRNATRGTS